MDSREDEETLKLIELYKNYPVLWKPSGPDNSKGIKKEIAWTKISQEFGESMENCKIRMKKVISNYRKEKSRMKEFQKAGLDYVSKSNAFKALKFLPDQDRPKQINAFLHMMILFYSVNSQMFVIPQKRQKFTGLDEIMKRTSNSPSDNHKLNAFTNDFTTKMYSYSKETRKGVEHSINKILMYADQGLFEQHYSNFNQPSTSYELTQGNNLNFQNIRSHQTEETQQNTTNPNVSTQSSDENSVEWDIDNYI
ncbi:hypothetical protein FQA39_LY12116 [Lamprigera yunnana]|nr:hypothetical protein FQA39_LY12116 [Lamprigera yunnana]